ncbi:MAG: ABC transporter substrate-binding protein [Ramlibacter sp.]|uniref:ABC transporter substrate-binding protein n=1 Tax=Ramlibacter sp. TaxID=1917967 RepID=UPI002620C030|nr:ABC transporter substrate-binding protein [Ramlibacter sp.]MDH4377746.1 ABC transporter substrate-binding protein [Ramlibacter sp.]
MDMNQFNDMLIGRRSLLGASAAGLALGAGLAGPAQAQANAKVLTVGGAFVPLSMDPANSGNGRAGLHLAPAYEPLVRTQADGKFAPALATAWELSADSREVTFTLRQGAKFSDGEPVTAEACKKSIEYFVGKKGPFAANLASMTGIDVLDTYRFKVKVSVPQPALIELFNGYWLAGYIISPKGLASANLLGAQTFGAGPYKLDHTATVTGKTYTFLPNEHYYDKSRIKWEKLVITVFEDQNAGIQAMKAGQIKLLVSDPLSAQAGSANLSKNMRIQSDAVGWTGLILMDRDGQVQPFLKDVRVRQAINHAIDRKLISQALLGRFAEPSLQLQSRGFMGYDAALEKRYPFDPAKAKQLMEAAGFPNGFELKVGYVNNTLSRFLTQAIAGQLKKIGIKFVTEEYQGFGPFLAAGRNKSYSALVFNSNSSVPNLARFQTLDAKGSLNTYGSEDATLTKLMNEAALLPLAKAEAAWKKVYAQAVELAWFAPVAAVHVCYFATSDVKMPQAGQSLVVDLIDVVPAK